MPTQPDRHTPNTDRSPAKPIRQWRRPRLEKLHVSVDTAFGEDSGGDGDLETKATG